MSFSYSPDAHPGGSLSALDWSNAGFPTINALQMAIPKSPDLGGGFEMFYHRAYPFGLSSEYAGLWEAMVDGFSLRYNFRYAHLLPKTLGNGPTLYIGDRLDTSALYVQMVGTLRVDENEDYVIDPVTGQPFIDNPAVELTVRTFRGDEEGGYDAGDMRFVVRGSGRHFEWKRGPKGSAATLMYLDGDDLTVGGLALKAKIAELEDTIASLTLRMAAVEALLP